jgi:hypothetical protein
MFKLTKFSICIVGMIVGITIIGALPFMGLTCRGGVRVYTRRENNKLIL